MTQQEALTLIEGLIPAAIGGTLGLLAILGIRELIKEASAAFNKRANA